MPSCPAAEIARCSGAASNSRAPSRPPAKPTVTARSPGGRGSPALSVKRERRSDRPRNRTRAGRAPRRCAGRAALAAASHPSSAAPPWREPTPCPGMCPPRPAGARSRPCRPRGRRSARRGPGSRGFEDDESLVPLPRGGTPHGRSPGSISMESRLRVRPPEPAASAIVTSMRRRPARPRIDRAAG